MVILLVTNSCKTKYEEIPPEFPDLESVVPIDTLDYNVDLWDLDGKLISLAKFKNEVIFLNIWGTWCGPCRAEMPGIQRLYNSMKYENVKFVLISDESIDTIKTFINSNNYNLPIYKYQKPLPKSINTTSYPTTFIINRNGEIVFRYKLSAKWDHGSTIKFLKHFILN
jgi:thiol-disulfide isomerase/thioredoxin